VLSFVAGHTHEVVAPALAGTLTVDIDDPARSTVSVTIDATTLRVTGTGEPPEDVPKVQETTSGRRVLDVQRYPVMTFTSTSIAISSRTGATLQTMVTGRLTLHDVTRSITVPTVRTDGDSLTAIGHFPVKQTEYGMKPVSVGGVVSVKDTVNIGFTIVAR
jgi:polyisoprenoid-binding protein YceI